MATVIVGLGNPGGEYAKTRHNAGRMVVEAYAQYAEFEEFALRKAANASVTEGVIDAEKVQLVLPEVFMNHSGKGVTSFVKSVKAAKKLLVVRDDLDLPIGVIKLTVHGRGSGGHKGVESIMRSLKTKEFAQLKIGISGATPKGKIRKPEAGEEVVGHVIGKFSPKEMELLKKVFEKTNQTIQLFATEDIEAAMLFANTK
ncbi:MAG: Aminoacyl-tRNA hydrolase, peptidyl-tRNA hydrolase, family [Parcubacteria group bacterium]|nr:Aminoacyl-tRNA hydrolase, peptidyl-tRNA hydrolase, family [Parcubacteria group bacterium]